MPCCNVDAFAVTVPDQAASRCIQCVKLAARTAISIATFPSQFL